MPFALWVRNRSLGAKSNKTSGRPSSKCFFTSLYMGLLSLDDFVDPQLTGNHGET